MKAAVCQICVAYLAHLGERGKGLSAEHGPCPACQDARGPRAQVCAVCRLTDPAWAEGSALEQAMPNGEHEWTTCSPDPLKQLPRGPAVDPLKCGKPAHEFTDAEKALALSFARELSTGESLSDEKLAKQVGVSRSVVARAREFFLGDHYKAVELRRELAQARATSSRRRTQRQRDLIEHAEAAERNAADDDEEAA